MPTWAGLGLSCHITHRREREEGPALGDVCEGAAVVGEGKRRLRVRGHRVPTSSAPHPGPEGEESEQRA